jgi:lipid II:glycine glycyltransferase (peptidoglycan interpeptide bridge formation enzyme)
VLSKGGAVIAAIITLQHKSTVVYKYGCSDERFHNLGGMPFLIWRTIEEAKLSGADEVDLGRSDVGAHGLIAFKGKFGATSSNLVYKIIPGSPGAAQSTANKLRLAQRIFRQLPESAFIFAGRVIYPHIG